jgi:hypothetical protein
VRRRSNPDVCTVAWPPAGLAVGARGRQAPPLGWNPSAPSCTWAQTLRGAGRAKNERCRDRIAAAAWQRWGHRSATACGWSAGRANAGARFWVLFTLMLLLVLLAPKPCADLSSDTHAASVTVNSMHSARWASSGGNAHAMNPTGLTTLPQSVYWSKWIHERSFYFRHRSSGHDVASRASRPVLPGAIAADFRDQGCSKHPRPRCRSYLQGRTDHLLGRIGRWTVYPVQIGSAPRIHCSCERCLVCPHLPAHRVPSNPPKL